MNTRIIAVSPLITKRWFTEAIGWLLKHNTYGDYKLKCEIDRDPINAKNIGVPENDFIMKIQLEHIHDIINIDILEEKSKYAQGYMDALMCVNNFTKEEE